MHISILAVFLLYWSPFISLPLKLPHLQTDIGKIAYLIVEAMQGMILSAIILFSNVVLYNFYNFLPHLGNISALFDQQLGGAIMLIAGMITTIITAIVILNKKH